MPNTQSSFCDIMWVEVPYAVLHILESKWLIAVSAVLYCHIISLSHLPFSPTSIFYLVNTASCQEMSAYTWKHWSGWKGCSISDRPVGGAVMLLQITEENGEQDMEHAHKVTEVGIQLEIFRLLNDFSTTWNHCYHSLTWTYCEPVSTQTGLVRIAHFTITLVCVKSPLWNFRLE